MRPNPGTNRAYQTAIDRPDGRWSGSPRSARRWSIAAIDCRRELYGNVFVAEPAANFVEPDRRHRRRHDASRAQGVRQRASSSRLPTSASGRSICPMLPTERCTSSTCIAASFRIARPRPCTCATTSSRESSMQPIGLGRIYRVVHETTRLDTVDPFASASPAQLVEALSPSERLASRHGAAPARRARSDLGRAGAREARRQRDGLRERACTRSGRSTGSIAIEPATGHQGARGFIARRASVGVRLAERWLGQASHPIQAAVLKRLDDADWAVREQLAASLGALPPGPRETAIASMLERHADDPIVVDAALSGVRGQPKTAVLEKTAAVRGRRRRSRRRPRSRCSPRRSCAAARTRRFRCVLASLADEDGPAGSARRCSAAPRSPCSAPRCLGMPDAAGAAVPAAAELPCPTCPGGRAGPGGAYAFRAPGATTAAAAASGPFGLNREPAALSALAAPSGELSTRARQRAGAYRMARQARRRGAARAL